MLGFSEDVQRKRFWPVLDKFDCFVKRLVRHDGEYRSENFTFHDIHVRRDVCKDCDGRITVLDVANASDNLRGALCDGVLDECCVAFDGAFIDNVDQVFAFVAHGVGIAVHLLDFVRERFGEFLDFVLRTKCVVRRDASLSAVESLSPGNSFDGALDVHVGE